MKCRLSFFPGLSAGVALSALVGTPAAHALPAFQVNESAIAGTPDNTFTADRLSFGYGARIAQVVTGGSLAGTGDVFREAGYINMSSWGDGSGNVPAYLNSFGPVGYQLYATFVITGETDFGQGGSLINASFSSVDLQLYADPNSNTKFGTTGSTISGGSQVDFTRTNTTDDVLLGTATLSAGEANVYASLASGDFGVNLLLSLNSAGKNLFNVPNNFYKYMHVHGTTNLVTNGAAMLAGGISDIGGGGTISFSNGSPAAVPVPEPGSALLVGGGLLALYATSRRRRGNKA